MIGPAARSGTPTGPDPRAFAPDRRSIGRAGWHRRTGLIPLVYLAGIIAIGFAHPVLAQWRWLGIHVLLLGAVTNAIVIWSAHFTAAVLHAPSPASRRGEALRLAGLNIGVLAVLAGGALDLGWIGVGGAGVVFAAICAHLYWLRGRLRATLPAPYRFTVHYYLAASIALLTGIPQGLVNLGNQNALYYQADPARMGSSAGLLRTFMYLGAIAASTGNGIFFGARATTSGMHHLAIFMLLVAAVFLALTLADRSLGRVGTVDSAAVEEAAAVSG